VDFLIKYCTFIVHSFISSLVLFRSYRTKLYANLLGDGKIKKQGIKEKKEKEIEMSGIFGL